ncbi:hypothetical protein D3C80_1627480 [compost metagenome]
MGAKGCSRPSTANRPTADRVKRRSEKVVASQGAKAIADTDAALYTANSQAPSSAPMPMAPRMSLREILVTASLRPAHNTASNTPNSPTTTCRPNADCAGAAGAGAAANAAEGAVRELMGYISSNNFRAGASLRRSNADEN